MNVAIEKQEQYLELVQTLVTKSWESPAFKSQLISNPKTTIEGITGRPVNKEGNFKVVVEDQSDSSVIYLNIPAKPSLEDLELTEEQLELIAGGGPFYEAGVWVGKKIKAGWNYVFG